MKGGLGCLMKGSMAFLTELQSFTGTTPTGVVLVVARNTGSGATESSTAISSAGRGIFLENKDYNDKILSEKTHLFFNYIFK